MSFDETNIIYEIKEKFEELQKFQIEMSTFLKEVSQILNKVKKTDNDRLKAIFEKFDLYIKAYMSISNPASIPEPSDKTKDLQLQLDEAIAQINDYKSK